MRRQRFLLASIPAALAVVSRPQGVLLLAPLGIELWLDLRRRRREGRPLLHLGLAAPVPALALAVAWQIGVAPHPRAACRRPRPPCAMPPEGRSARRGTNGPPQPSHHEGDGAEEQEHHEQVQYVGYAVISLIPMMVTETQLAPITSNGRYTLVLFPVFAVLALAAHRRWLDRTVVFTFVPLLVLATFHFVHYGKIT
jgi:hypothetical protein